MILTKVFQSPTAGITIKVSVSTTAHFVVILPAEVSHYLSSSPCPLFSRSLPLDLPSDSAILPWLSVASTMVLNFDYRLVVAVALDLSFPLVVLTASLTAGDSCSLARNSPFQAPAAAACRIVEASPNL
jgi:hypothetical protein